MPRRFDHPTPENGLATQSRAMSVVEAVINVIVGYIIAVATQMIVFPVVGIRVPIDTNLMVGAIFTIVSIARSYALRRMFEALRMRTLKRRATAPAGGGRASVSPSQSAIR